MTKEIRVRIWAMLPSAIVILLILAGPVGAFFVNYWHTNFVRIALQSNPALSQLLPVQLEQIIEKTCFHSSTAVIFGMLMSSAVLLCYGALQSLMLRPLSKLNDAILHMGNNTGSDKIVRRLTQGGEEAKQDYSNVLINQRRLHSTRARIAALLYNFKLMQQRVRQQIHDLKSHNADRESALRVKDSFVANMSHEIRTPLNGLLGMADLLADSALDEFQQEQLQMIRQSGNDLLNVINDILDYSKIESGNMQIEQEPFDIWELAEDAIKLFARRAHEKNLDFNLYIDPCIRYKLIGDSHKIKQILRNLVSNAIKFTAQGMVFLRIDKDDSVIEKNATKEGAIGLKLCGLKCSVIDTGIGIEKESQRTIFESFNQADVSTTRRFGGTGLGLTISKRLSALMGGTLTLDPHQEVGSTFILKLALLRDQEIEHISSDLVLNGEHLVCLGLDPLSAKVIDLYAQHLGLVCHNFADLMSAQRLLPTVMHNENIIAAVIIDLHISTLSHITQWRLKHPAVSCIGIDRFDRLNRTSVQQSGLQKIIAKPIRYKHFKSMLAQTTAPEIQFSDAHDRQPVQQLTQQIQLQTQQQLNDYRGRHILLAEDNLINQKLIRAYLKPLPVTIHIANTGLEAVRILSEQHIDLVLMDCHMPDMDGYEATRWIRDHEQPQHPGEAPQSDGAKTAVPTNQANIHTDAGGQKKSLPQHRSPVPIIALTANAMSDDRDKCLAAGMNDYLSKPIRASVLHEKIRQWLRERTP